MKSRNIVAKAPISISQAIIAVVIIMWVFYTFGFQNSDTRFCSLDNYWLWLILLLFYLYVQFVNSSFYYYDNKLVVWFPFRPFKRRFEFSLADIQFVQFKNINNLGVYSSVKIKSKRKSPYEFAFTGSSKKMKELLSELEKGGIPIEIIEG